MKIKLTIDVSNKSKIFDIPTDQPLLEYIQYIKDKDILFKNITVKDYKYKGRILKDKSKTIIEENINENEEIIIITDSSSYSLFRSKLSNNSYNNIFIQIDNLCDYIKSLLISDSMKLDILVKISEIRKNVAEKIFENFKYILSENSIEINGKKGKCSFMRMDNGDEFIGDINNVGIMKWKEDDSMYFGEFKQGKINGFGISLFKSGSIQYSKCNNGQYHGFFVYKTKDGFIREGIYNNGKVEGETVFYGINGKKRKELWEYGRKIKNIAYDN